MVGTTTLGGLEDHLKLGREYAPEGLYDTSVIFFDGAIAQMNKHLDTLDDPLIRTKWMNAKKSLSEELQFVKQLDSEVENRTLNKISGMISVRKFINSLS